MARTRWTVDGEADSLRLMWIVPAVVLIDQATKGWISYAMTPGESRLIIPGLLRFTYLYNPGAAFGLFQSQQLLLVTVSVAVLVYGWIRRDYISRQSVAARLGIALGLGGAAGNTLDRLWRGAVLDFIDVPWIPVFNVADTAIVLGVIIMSAVLLFQPARPETRLDPEASLEPGAGLVPEAGLGSEAGLVPESGLEPEVSLEPEAGLDPAAPVAQDAEQPAASPGAAADSGPAPRAADAGQASRATGLGAFSRGTGSGAGTSGHDEPPGNNGRG